MVKFISQFLTLSRSLKFINVIDPYRMWRLEAKCLSHIFENEVFLSKMLKASL